MIAVRLSNLRRLMSTIEENISTNSDNCGEACPQNAILPTIVDQRFDDFDAQSEQLSGHDQEYAQLSAGTFSGRFVSAFADAKVSIHCEKASQSLEQWIGCPKDIVSIGLVLEEASGFSVNGRSLGVGDVMITRPGGEMNLFSPANGAIMAICIERQLLSETVGDRVSVSLFADNRADVETFHCPVLAKHLRSDALEVLRALRSGETADLSKPFISALTAQLSLHAALAESSVRNANTARQQDFVRTKKLVSAMPTDQIDYDWLCQRTRSSRRSIQTAFAKHAQTSPSRYLRTIRLNRARRMLLGTSKSTDSIGDIAAACGFWNWSRFSQEYKALFRELPSQTRARVQARSH